MLKSCTDSRPCSIPEFRLLRRSSVSTSHCAHSCAAVNPRGTSRPAVQNVALDCTVSHQDFQGQDLVNSNNGLNGAHHNATFQTHTAHTQVLPKLSCWVQPGLDPPQLTGLIKRTRTLQELQLVVENHRHEFNRIHIAAAITHLPKVACATSTSESTPSPFHSSNASHSATHIHPTQQDVNITSTLPLVHSMSHHHLELIAAQPHTLAHTTSPPTHHQLPIDILSALLPEFQLCIQQYSARELCNCAWAVARLHPPNTHTILEQLMAELQGSGKLATAKGMELGSLVWALAKSSYPDPAAYAHIQTTLLLPNVELDCQALSNSAWALAAAGQLRPDLMDAIAKQALLVMHDLRPQHLANLSWACAKSSLHTPTSCTGTSDTHTLPAFLAAVRTTALSQLKGFEPQGLSTLAWSFGVMRCRDPSAAALIAGVAAEVVQRQGAGCSVQSLANVLWACARVGVRDAGLLALVGQAAASPQAQDSWCPCSVSTVTWSLVKMGAADLDTLASLWKLAEAGLTQFSAHQLAVFLWSCANVTSSSASTALTDAAFVQAAALLDGCKPQELLMLAVATTRLECKDPDFLPRLAAASRKRLRYFKPKEISNLLWVLSRHQYHPRRLFAAAAAVTVQQLMFYKPEELAKLAVAFSRGPRRADNVLRAVAKEARREMRDKFSIASIANLLGALAESGVYDVVLMDLAACRVVECCGGGCGAGGVSRDQAASISSTFIKLGHRHEALQQLCLQAAGGGKQLGSDAGQQLCGGGGGSQAGDVGGGDE